MRPMLAAKTPNDVSVIQFPILASAKLDGVRCLIKDGAAVSRKLLPIPNRHIQSILGRNDLEGFDGELIVGPPTAENAFRVTTSGVMSVEGEPDFKFYVFDRWNDKRGFEQRLLGLRCNTDRVVILPHVLVNNMRELDQYENAMLAEGYEGVIVRDPSGPYKYGESTIREGGMIKIKRFVDDEAQIIGFEELMRNNNEASVDELGLTKRSGRKENLVPMATLGALICRTITGNGDVEFKIGSGLDPHTRRSIWENRESLLGLYVKYRSFPVGVKKKPRFPTFLGFRHAIDM